MYLYGHGNIRAQQENVDQGTLQYATWPDDTIRANVLAIMSFTLNRVYTEWYRNHHPFSIAEI